jgi:flagellar motor switch protein FliM
MVMKARELLLDGAGISVDRMPLLHVIFERMAAQCSESLRQLSASPALFLVESAATE